MRHDLQVNRVAMTTAVAAQRAVELSLIPDEADSRKRREESSFAVSSPPTRRSAPIDSNAATCETTAVSPQLPTRCSNHHDSSTRRPSHSNADFSLRLGINIYMLTAHI